MPPQLLNVLQSSLNMLTAESLNRVVHTNESAKNLSARVLATGGRAQSSSTTTGGASSGAENSPQDEDEYKYILFVWDGIESSALTKANALAKAIELQTLFTKARDDVLKVLFSGGVIRGKKLQRGSVYILADMIEQTSKKEASSATAAASTQAQISPAQLTTFYERIFLLRCMLSPPHASLTVRESLTSDRAAAGGKGNSQADASSN